MQKRGVSTVFAIFSIAASIIILIAATNLAKRVATAEDVRQPFLAKDIALMFDALHAVPGNVQFNYKTTNFTQKITIDVIEANSVKVAPLFGQEYVFSFRPGIPTITSDEFSIGENKADVIEFIKSDSKIAASKKEVK